MRAVSREGDWESVASRQMLRIKTGQSHKVMAHWVLNLECLPSFTGKSISMDQDLGLTKG